MQLRNEEKHINRVLWLLLILSAVIRGFLAAFMEFSNDEVYYWTYALYPDWSHFDHPPMVGWMIQLFSFNLLFDSEFFIRLASVVLMTGCTYVMFRIGKEIKDAQTGLYAALLYTASVYAFVITGVFIMPDTPMMLFWLLAFWQFVRFFKAEHPKNMALLWAGLFAGLSMLSKYTGVFLWVGVALYILIFNRKHLNNPWLYLSVLLSGLCCLPILIWNMQNAFVSFDFHGDRVGLSGGLQWNSFTTELAGEFFYNNPVNIVLVVVALIAVARKKRFVNKMAQRLILCVALPMLALFLLFSLTRPILPHWNSPAYVMLILLGAGWLGEKNRIADGKVKIPPFIVAALSLLLLILTVGVAEIKTGFIPLDRHEEADQYLGKDDFTLDMYGWRQLGEKFAQFRGEMLAKGEMQREDGFVGDKWFPLSHVDYYVARPLHLKVLGYGYLGNLHKYLWTNEKKGGFVPGADYWFITDSRYFSDPNEAYRWQKFQTIELLGTIDIERGGRKVRHFYVYACKGLLYGQSNIRQNIEKKKETK